MNTTTTNITTYNPAWLVALAKEKLPGLPRIATALQECILCQRESEGYLRFVYPQHPTRGKVSSTILLHDATHGNIIIDVLDNGSIAGIEFLDVVLGYDCRALLEKVRKEGNFFR